MNFAAFITPPIMRKLVEMPYSRMTVSHDELIPVLIYLLGHVSVVIQSFRHRIRMTQLEIVDILYGVPSLPVVA